MSKRIKNISQDFNFTTAEAKTTTRNAILSRLVILQKCVKEHNRHMSNTVKKPSLY